MTQQRAAMTMADYLAEVRHAVEGLLPLVWQEQDTLSGRKEQLAERKAGLARLEQQVRDEYASAAWLLNNPELDDEGIGILRHWDNYFGPDTERYYLDQQIPGMQAAVELLEVSVEAHRFSVDALAGAVIQFAKQGRAELPAARSRLLHHPGQRSKPGLQRISHPQHGPRDHRAARMARIQGLSGRPTQRRIGQEATTARPRTRPLQRPRQAAAARHGGS